MNQYNCPSYYDNDNVLQDCTCGKCGTPDKVEEIMGFIYRADKSMYNSPEAKEADLRRFITTTLTQHDQDRQQLLDAVCGIIDDELRNAPLEVQMSKGIVFANVKNTIKNLLDK